VFGKLCAIKHNYSFAYWLAGPLGLEPGEGESSSPMFPITSKV
jgi:hypothetical protein